MPVTDHPVHEKTKRALDAKYGCYDRKPYEEGYYAPDRIYKEDKTFEIVQTYIPHNLSRSCNFDMSHTDLGCKDCFWSV